MQKRLLYPIISLIAAVTGVILIASTAHAVSPSSFNPGHIIDDAVFYNAGSMTSAQIQTFLNSKVPTCDTNGTKPATEKGYPNLTHAQYAAAQNNPTIWHKPPYTCLKDFKQDTPQVEAASGLCSALQARKGYSAAQIISAVATACGINPQVLIVLLEKEQSLITDTWPLTLQYDRATGFACPDNVGGVCDPAFNGFFRQVYSAARQFKVYQKYPNDYNYIAGRTQHIYWQDNAGEFLNTTGSAANRNKNGQCGYSQVYIENQATAALYIYTPYRPNSAALNGYPGTGDACSAYGNRNFWFMFNGWFGSTIYTVKGSIKLYYDLPEVKATLGNPIENESRKGSGWKQCFDGGCIAGIADTGYWTIKGSIAKYYWQVGGLTSALGLPRSNEVKFNGNNFYQEYDNGYIIGNASTGYWAVKGSIRNAFDKLGASESHLGLPVKDEERLLGNIWSQQYQNGYIIGRDGYYYESSGVIRDYWISLGAQDGGLGLINGPIVKNEQGASWQHYKNGAIIVNPKNNSAWESKGSIRQVWAEFGFQDGALGYPVGPEKYSNGIWSQKYEKGTIETKAGIKHRVIFTE